jgi:hypothetical protein
MSKKLGDIRDLLLEQFQPSLLLRPRDRDKVQKTHRFHPPARPCLKEGGGIARRSQCSPGCRPQDLVVTPRIRGAALRSSTNSTSIKTGARTFRLQGPTRWSVASDLRCSLWLLKQAKIIDSNALLEPQFAPAFLLVAHACVPAPVPGSVAFAHASQPLR